MTSTVNDAVPMLPAVSLAVQLTVDPNGNVAPEAGALAPTSSEGGGGVFPIVKGPDRRTRKSLGTLVKPPLCPKGRLTRPFDGMTRRSLTLTLSSIV